MLGTVDDLIWRLSDLRLAAPEDLRRVRSELPANADAGDFLKRLEQTDVVTSYQATKIARGEAEHLIVGGCKLMYQNASGSFARLYRGARLDNGEMVGIKVLRDRWAKDTNSVQLFLREGEIGKRFRHPNIVPIYQVGTSGKFHYIIMEFVEGGNLKDFLKIRGKLAPIEALQYTLHVSRALEAALALGATHRDMKTSNILMSSQGVAKLIDFGLASEKNPASNDDLAQALEYSTLEKNTGAPRNDPRSDLFFLGAVLYELLIGEPPYPPTKVRAERKDFARYRNIQRIAFVDSSLPASVTDIVDNLLAINPAHRYQTPTAVIADLEAALRTLGQPVAAPSAGAGVSPDDKVMLIVENRPKQQDMLRDYFTRHGYRVLLLGNADRALARLKAMTPHGVILFDEAAGPSAEEDFQKALQLTNGQRVAVILVLSKPSRASAMKANDPRGTILSAPVNLRKLREAVEQLHSTQVENGSR